MIYDENWNKIDTPDLNAGYLVRKDVEYYARYVVDTPAVVERQIVKEYPNGGKEIKTVVIAPEVGHWEAVFENGLSAPFEIEAPAHVDKTRSYCLVATLDVYKPYTAEELESKAQQIEEERTKAERTAKYEALLLGLEEWQQDHDKSLSKLNQALIEAKNSNTERDTVIGNQNTRLLSAEEVTRHLDEKVSETETMQSALMALGELGEMAADYANSDELFSVLLAAVAELGEMVTAQEEILTQLISNDLKVEE